MKQFKFMAMTAAGLLLVSSCSSDEMVDPKGDGNVTFTLEVPARLATRAFGDGQKALNLTYAVYESGSQTPVIVSQNEVKFTDLKATVSLKLVNGKSYDFVWWAQSPDATCYTFDAATQSVTVDYANVPTNDESRDAFFQHSTFMVTGPVNETVRLYRPFAQVNFGTDDLNEPAVKAAFGNDYASLTTSVTAKAYTTLNLFTEAATGQTDVTFTPAGIPSGEIFPVGGYDYLSMDYLLMTKGQELQDISFSVLENGTKKFNEINISNVPFQRNYRTNIYGQLLTSTSNYNVIIEPDFEKPDYDLSLPIVQVNDADSFIEAFNGKDCTVQLTEDINLPEELMLTSGNFVLDLNGNSLATTNDNYTNTILLGGDANLTVKNGVIKATSNYRLQNAAIWCGQNFTGTLTIEDGAVIRCSDYGMDWDIPLQIQGGTCIVNGGIIEGTECSGGSPAIEVYGAGNLTVNGGVITGGTGSESKRSVAVSNGSNNVVTITGGTFRTSDSANAKGDKITLAGEKGFLISGGVFYGVQPDANWLKEGFSFSNTGTETDPVWTVE